MYICILCGVLPLTPFFFLFLEVEVPPPMFDGALVKEVITAQSTTALGVEKKPPSGGVAREARQAIKDAQPLLSPISLAV